MLKSLVYSFADFKEEKKEEEKKSFSETDSKNSNSFPVVFQGLYLVWCLLHDWGSEPVQLQSAQIKWGLGSIYHRPCHLKHLHKGHVCLSNLSHIARSEHQSAAFCVCWGHTQNMLHTKENQTQSTVMCDTVYNVCWSLCPQDTVI